MSSKVWRPQNQDLTTHLSGGWLSCPRAARVGRYTCCGNPEKSDFNVGRVFAGTRKVRSLCHRRGEVLLSK